ncbi:MAG: cell division protein SepF [Clostridia bacterium]|nr:cell division protein SepF [Clostridia bacterium]
MAKKDTLIKLDEVFLYRPQTFEEIEQCLDELMQKGAVVIRFEKLDKNLKQRFLDNLCGATYVLDGEVKKLKDTDYLFVKSGVVVC